MKKLAFLITVLFFMSINAATSAASNSKVIGSWKIRVADAPYEYSTSTLTISEISGKLAGNLVFADGQTIKTNQVSYANDVLKFSVSIEGYDIPFNGKINGNTISGTVDTPEGTMSVQGEKQTLIGTWDYSAPNAPYDYSTGKIVFAENDGKTSGKVILGSYEVVAKDLKIENLSFSFSVEIEYENVKVSGKLANGKISAKADSPEGIIDITATRTKAKTN